MAQYGKSWGSVSTNFTRTTGFTSETKRLSQAAEDQYRKEKDQLSSMKETAAFDSRQMRSSAAMADKASAYELKALSKFSGKLNTFLQGTAAEWYKEEKAKDIKNKITEFKTNRVKWNEEKVKLEELIAGTSDNDKKVAELQEKLKAHNLLDPNSEENIAKLSGNEKIAYYSVTAAEQVEGAEGKYYNWVGEKGEETVIADWLPEEEYKDDLGNTQKRHPRIKINQITEPAGKRFLKDKFLAEQMEANPMGGLKEDYRVLLLGEPMSAALDKIQATEVTNFKQDQAQQKWDSTIQKVTNRIAGVPPFDNESNLGKEFNAALAEAGTIFVQTGKGTRQDGMNALFTSLMASVTSQTDKEKMQQSFERLMALGNEEITTGPNAGSTVKEAYGGPGGRWNETDITKEYHKALGTIKDRQEQQTKGQVEADVLSIKDTVSKGIAQEKEAWTPAQAKAEAEKLWEGLNEKYRNNEYALTLIESMKGEATIGFTKEDWEAKWIDLGATYRGVIPRKELAGIPKAYEQEFVKEHGWEVVTTIPGRKGTTNQSLHDSHLGAKGTLYTAIREVEKINGQANPNGDTDIVYDLAGDKYQARVNQLVLVGDENGKKYSHREAMITANNEIVAMIRNPSKLLGDDKTPNPFYASPNDSKEGAGNAWYNNEEVNKHQLRGNRLLSPGESVSKFAQAKVNEITNAGNKVQPSKDYLLTPINIDSETFQVKDSKQLEILGGLNNRPPGGALTMTYRKLGHNSGAKNFGDFVNKQRIAILRQTSPNGDPRNSTLWTDHPELMAAWFGGSKIENQRSGYMNSSSTNRDASALQSDYGGGELSPGDAEAIVSGQGRETVIGGYN